MENNKPRFHGLTMRDGVTIFVIVLSFAGAFVANRTHVQDELSYVTQRIEVGERKQHALEGRVREVEIYKAGSQERIDHLSEQIALVNQKLDRVLERLRR